MNLDPELIRGGIITCVGIILSLLAPEIRKVSLGHQAAIAPSDSWTKVIRLMALIFVIIGLLYAVIGISWKPSEVNGIMGGGTGTDTVSTQSQTATTSTGTETATTSPIQPPGPSQDIRRIGVSEFVSIPSGRCTIGCEQDCAEDDFSARLAVFPKAFLLMRHEVTNAEYEACVNAGVCARSEGLGNGQPQGDLQPVVNVDAFQAQTYCSWLGARLPTESEWEYAARAGESSFTYPWGAEFDSSAGAFARGSASDVMSFRPNAMGLHDMGGNVAEWTVTDRGTGLPRIVIRGGSYKSTPEKLRVSRRVESDPHRASSSIGFRCLIDSE